MTNQFRIGDRISLHSKGTGIVAFTGTTKFASGEWVGIILDNPVGRNNGSVENFEYFKCPPGHGIFIRPGQVLWFQNFSMSI
ncbi:hypothetical protein GJ496_007029 [Pomphorhynchus laevis]|nr:hypothetical protein GJ496_007029 [Pomphorhynchus laevis]